ncbi:MAG: hypothetical protein AMQ22_00197 [Candidatus Methanofastidiosum methylothiophilum]|uniref:Putative DnaT-like domain-containing protein n=1 Tax=Candidatus Methanofastidiosum methylothiophilum TaxID=1705564 RepID=A0A150IS59_9EURY|nr:MAG: hypothetical protein APG11_00844 [Candidatus Methanofastidiosum methylthiophilus]KYC53526.1 MAG: hypothetical protein AMQ22_00197 [Candidatus Methanofastidiosum methylthiophilus]
MALPAIKVDVAAADANSYITLTEADDILAGETVWDGLTNDQKTSYILQAAQLLDAREFVGEKYSTDQALEFPRNFQVNGEGTPFIHWVVKFEQTRIALWLAKEYGGQIDVNEIDLDEIRLKFNNNLLGYRFNFINGFVSKSRLVVKE